MKPRRPGPFVNGRRRARLGSAPGGLAARESKSLLAIEEWLVVAGAVLALALISMVLFIDPSENEFEPLGAFEISWRVAPGTARVRRSEPNENSEVAVYLDLSRPVGGFLPVDQADGNFSPFRAWLNAVPARLIELAGPGSPVVTWHGIANDVSPLPAPPPLSRALFVGTQSRLDKAVTALERDFESGRIRAGALLTDMVATDDVHGALRVGTVLSEWIRRAQSEGSDLHFGLLGIRATYRGIEVGGCPWERGVGCWLSEQTGQFHRLPAPVGVPFYALVVGHGLESVRGASESLQALAVSFGFETRFEVISLAAEPTQEESACQARSVREPEAPQLILERGDGNRFRCRRDEAVEITCPLPAGLGEPAVARTSWPHLARARAAAGQVVIALDCASAFVETPPGDLIVQVEGPPTDQFTVDWTTWSSETDERSVDLGRTLLLVEFIRSVRYVPAKRVATSSPILTSESG